MEREVTAEDRENHAYFSHMGGLVGTVQSVFDNEIGVRIDLEILDNPPKDVHKVATKQLREKFLGAVSEEHKKMLEKDELNFVPNYVLLVKADDLVKAN